MSTYQENIARPRVYYDVCSSVDGDYYVTRDGELAFHKGIRFDRGGAGPFNEDGIADVRQNGRPFRINLLGEEVRNY